MNSLLSVELYLNLFPANVPTRELDFFRISSSFHVENDVILRILQFKIVQNIHCLRETIQFFVFGIILFTNLQRRQPSRFLLGGKKVKAGVDWSEAWFLAEMDFEIFLT